MKLKDICHKKDVTRKFRSQPQAGPPHPGRSHRCPVLASSKILTKIVLNPIKHSKHKHTHTQIAVVELLLGTRANVFHCGSLEAKDRRFKQAESFDRHMRSHEAETPAKTTKALPVPLLAKKPHRPMQPGTYMVPSNSKHPFCIRASGVGRGKLHSQTLNPKP